MNPLRKVVTAISILFGASFIGSFILALAITAFAGEKASEIGILEHTGDLVKIVTPLFGIIGGLVVYAFHRLEKSDEKVIDTIEQQAKENDTAHDQLFKLVRELTDKVAKQEAKFEHLKGEHDTIKSRCVGHNGALP